MDYIDALKPIAAWIGAAALLAVMALCLVGIFSRVYRDNWPQYVGLWLIVIAGGLRLGRMVQRWWLTDVWNVSWPQFVLYIGLLLFAIGTARKVIQQNRKPTL